MDMLDGVLISDFGLEILPEFDLATDEEKNLLLKEYTKFLKRKTKKMMTDVEKDPELKKIMDGAKFINALAKGEVEIEKQSKSIEPEKMN